MYQSIAISEGGKETLYEIWNKEKKINNLFLNESDFSSLAMTLAILEHVKAIEILQEQQTRISNQR